MLGKDPHLALHARQGDHLHVFGVGRAVRRDDFEFQRVGHVRLRASLDAQSGLDFVDPALHVEVAFRHVVVFAVEDLLEAAHGFGHRDLLALAAGEHLAPR